MGLIKLLLTEDQLSLFSDDESENRLSKKKLQQTIKDYWEDAAADVMDNTEIKTLDDAENFFYDVGEKIITDNLDVRDIDIYYIGEMVVHSDPDGELLGAIVEHIYPEFVQFMKYFVHKSGEKVSSDNVYELVTHEMKNFLFDEGMHEADIDYGISKIDKDDIKYTGESIEFFEAEEPLKLLIEDYVYEMCKRGIDDSWIAEKIDNDVIFNEYGLTETVWFIDYYMDYVASPESDFYTMMDYMRSTVEVIDGIETIYAEREMGFRNISKFFESMKNKLGIFWSWEEGVGEAHGAPSGNFKVLVRAQIPVPSINWTETVEVTYWDLNYEKEVRTYTGQKIYISEIEFTDSSTRQKDDETYRGLINLMYPNKSESYKRELKEKVIQYYKDNNMTLWTPKSEKSLTFDDYLESKT